MRGVREEKSSAALRSIGDSHVSNEPELGTVKRTIENIEGIWLVQIESSRGHNEAFRRVRGRELGKTEGST